MTAGIDPVLSEVKGKISMASNNVSLPAPDDVSTCEQKFYFAAGMN